MDVLNQIESDFRAEITGALLLNYNPELSRIIIDRIGYNIRGKSKDITNIHESFGLYDMTEKVVFQSSRQSIYETLPEQFFHPSTLGGLGRPDDEIIDEIRKQREKEKAARQFFKPFEQEAGYLQMYALLDELAFDRKASNDELLNLFEDGWNIVSKLPKRCALAFVYILPLMNEMRGNKEWAEKCFSFVTGFPVTITEDYSKSRVPNNKSSFILNECRLGIDTCLTGELNDGLYEWLIRIGPVPQKSIKDVIPGSGFDELMQYLIDQFTPIQLFTKWKIITVKECDTILDPNDENAARLGYSFYL